MSEMNCNLGKKFIIYGLATMLFYIISLIVLSEMKMQGPIAPLEYIEANPGVYETEEFIRGIPVAKTVIISAGLGGFSVTSHHYPAMFLLPIAVTAVAVLVLAIVMYMVEFAIMRKKKKDCIKTNTKYQKIR